MKKINTNDWKEFVIGELFEISRPIARSQAKYTEGNVPFVASGNYTNGIVKWCMPKEDEALDLGNCITVSPLDGSAFYQKENFLGRGGAGSAILMLRNDELTELSGLFIASVIRNALTKYSYSDQLNSQTIADEIIWLPIVKNTEKPDYTYMEKYMQKILNEVDINIENLKKVKEKQSVVDIKEWRDFVFGEVFEIQPQKEVSPIYALNNSQKSDVLYPFLGQSSENNCIISYIYLDDEVLLNNKEKDIAIIIHSNNHLSFCIDEPFYLKDGHGATSIFKNNNLNIYNVRFIIAVLNKTMENLFNYDVKATKDSLKTMIVKLPATSTGEPDWNYMEQRMKKEMNISEKIIGNFELLNIC